MNGIESVRRELSARRNHRDPDVAGIARALLDLTREPTSWVVSALRSERSKGYSPLERAILLEKTVTHHYMREFLARPTQYESEANALRNGWESYVWGIPVSEWMDVFGSRTVQTNILGRYQGLFDWVVPKKNRCGGLTILDAGCGAGVGAWAAWDAGLVGPYIGVDKLLPDLAWVLGCSIRPWELHLKRTRLAIKRYSTRPPNAEYLRADITKLPIPDDSVDMYLAVYAWYQVPDPTTALIEAVRVTKPGGVVLVSDNYQEAAASLVTPGHGGELRTIAWIINEGGAQGPIDAVKWHTTNMSSGEALAGLRQVRAALRCRHT